MKCSCHSPCCCVELFKDCIDRNTKILGLFLHVHFMKILSSITHGFHSCNRISVHSEFQTRDRTPANWSSSVVWANLVMNNEALWTKWWKKPCLSPAWAALGTVPSCCPLVMFVTCAPNSLYSMQIPMKRACSDHQRDPSHCGTLKYRADLKGLFIPLPKQQNAAVDHFLRFPQRNLTSKAWPAATDVSLSLVIAEGWRQAWDAPVVVGPGAFHAVTPREAGAAAALLDVLLAVGTHIACQEPWGEGIQLMCSSFIPDTKILFWIYPVNIRYVGFQTLSCAKGFPLLLEGVNISLQLSARAQGSAAGYCYGYSALGSWALLCCTDFRGGFWKQCGIHVDNKPLPCGVDMVSGFVKFPFFSAPLPYERGGQGV